MRPPTRAVAALCCLTLATTLAAQTPPGAGRVVARGLGHDYCARGEELLFGFVTARGKIGAVCRTPSGGMVYRFGTPRRVELTFPSDSGGPGGRFSFSYYNRPGGVANEGMETGDLGFTNGDFEYHVYFEYYAGADRASCGVRVRNPGTRRGTDVRAVTCRGAISRIRDVEGLREP